MVSPTGELALRHRGDEVAPECWVRFSAGRINEDGKIDQRSVEVSFINGAFSRVHWHDDAVGVECLGYDVPGRLVDDWPMLDTWTLGDDCPEPYFYRVMNSNWIPRLPSHFQHHRHYVLDGRDGCVEIVAESYVWREWILPQGESVDETIASIPFASGEESSQA